MIPARLSALPKREFILVSAGGAALIVVLAVSLLLVPAWKKRTELHKNLASLVPAAGSVQFSSQQLQRKEQSVEALARNLYGDMDGLPAVQLEAHIIGRLQSLSWDNKVELEAIQPQKGEVVDSFEELRFSVNLQGRYHDLYRWLDGLSRELGFVLIKSYEMEPTFIRDSDELEVSMILAAYRRAT